MVEVSDKSPTTLPHLVRESLPDRPKGVLDDDKHKRDRPDEVNR